MRQQSLDFRKELTTSLLRRIQSAESCSLVGVGSVGKSNLLQHLAEPDVLSHYLGDEATQYRVISIDPHLMGTLTADDDDRFRTWAAYELMMHRLYLAFYPFEVLGEEAGHFYSTYQSLRDGNNPLFTYLGVRYLELALDSLLRRGQHIVFMFDDVEALLRTLPPKFFLTLRGLRDRYKQHLSYLAFSRAPLPALVAQLKLDAQQLEPFTELFTDNVYYIGAYQRQDAEDMLDHLIQRHQKPDLPRPARDFIIYASGGYAGLLRASYRVMDALQPIQPEDTQNRTLVRRLAARRPVQIECETIWNSLTKAEQTLLQNIPRLKREDMTIEIQEAITMLVRKGLLRADNNQGSVVIEPPIFQAYVETSTDMTVNPTLKPIYENQ